MADEIAVIRAEVLQWRLLAALTWQVGATVLAGSLWNAVQLRTWTRGPVATILSLRAALTVCTLAALQAVVLLVLRQVWQAQQHRFNVIINTRRVGLHSRHGNR